MGYIRIGRMIRNARKRQSLTQEILAEKADISTSFLGHIERGTRKASVETIVKLAAALGLSLDVLLLPEQIGGVSDGDSHAASPEQMDDARALIELALTLIKEHS